MHGDIDQQLFTPYFYSRVACCGVGGGPMLDEVVGYGDHSIDLRVTAETCSCNLTATYGAARVPANRSFAACSVPFISKADPMWSHSARCSNYLYVQMQSQTVLTTWGALLGLSSIVLLPIFGKIADIYGRRKVFYWTTVMTCTVFCILTADAALRLAGNGPIYLTAPLLATGAIHDAISWAMLVDLIPEPADQARFFPLMTPILAHGSSGTESKSIASMAG